MPRLTEARARHRLAAVRGILSAIEWHAEHGLASAERGSEAAQQLGEILELSQRALRYDVSSGPFANR